MAARNRSGVKLVCDCGGQILPPLPDSCPHCGQKIAGVQHGLNWLPVVLVALMFAGLLAFVGLLWRIM